MSTLLKIDVSPRSEEHSISRRLSAQFAQEWKDAHRGGDVIERDLATTHLPFLELPWITGVYSDPASHDQAQRDALSIGDELIAELDAADEWVIATPMYNFAVPAKLKAYIDHVVRSGRTFRVSSEGIPEGLLKGKKATVIISSAGEFYEGAPMEAMDSEKPYLRTILGFIGVTDITFIQAGGTWKVDRALQGREDYLSSFTGQVATAARE